MESPVEKLPEQADKPLTPFEELALTKIHLMAQIAEIDAKMQVFKTEGRARNLVEIRSLMIENGLTQADLFDEAPSKQAKSKAGGGARAGTKVAAKFRDQAGNSWSGRGLKPKWLTAALEQGRKIEEFKV